jgi:phosphoribosyl 1,2-cyclic phosphodiesterase
MEVKIWGCRGSIPAPGRKTLRYGGESTCVEVKSENGEQIIIDCGSGLRVLGQELIKDKNRSDLRLLLTHSHWDHISGFPFFVPAYVPRFTITLCGGAQAQQSIVKYLTHQMEAPYFPVDFSAMRASFLPGCNFSNGYCEHSVNNGPDSIVCHSISLNHPNGGLGYKFVQGKKFFVFLTDNEIRYHHEEGLSRDDYVEFCKGANLLFHDAQYTEEEYQSKTGWGHSTYLDAVNLALDAGVASLGLFHHDPDHSDDFIDEQVKICREYIRKSGKRMKCFGCKEGSVIKV